MFSDILGELEMTVICHDLFSLHTFKFFICNYILMLFDPVWPVWLMERFQITIRKQWDRFIIFQKCSDYSIGFWVGQIALTCAVLLAWNQGARHSPELACDAIFLHVFFRLWMRILWKTFKWKGSSSDQSDVTFSKKWVWNPPSAGVQL